MHYTGNMKHIISIRPFKSADINIYMKEYNIFSTYIITSPTQEMTSRHCIVSHSKYSIKDITHL